MIPFAGRNGSLLLGPMWTDVGILMGASPRIEMLCQMHGEAATSRKAGLADEDDRYTWIAADLAFVE